MMCPPALGESRPRVLGQSVDLDVVLLRVCAYPVEDSFAQSGQVSRVTTWGNVRAAASRAVSRSPSVHCSRSVAIREVCRCSWLNTWPSATHGDTRMAGTR